MLIWSVSSMVDAPDQNSQNASTSLPSSTPWTSHSRHSGTTTALGTSCETWECFAQTIVVRVKRMAFL